MNKQITFEYNDEKGKPVMIVYRDKVRGLMHLEVKEDEIQDR